MILCCGEALIDMIPAPTKDGPDGFVPHVGGAVFNTAVALSRLEAPVGMLTGLSNDMFGQQLAASLTRDGVDTRHVIQSDRPTTLAFVQLVDGSATYTFMDENSAGRMLRETDLPALDPAVTTLFFGGISLACEPGATTYAALLQAQARDHVVMLDPNIRPGFIPDREAYLHRLDALIASSDIVKLSDEDLNWILPSPIPLADKARVIQQKGPAVVYVTQGDKGAFALGPSDALVEVPANPTEVVDTVGAGDTFNAGVLASLYATGCLQKESLRNLQPKQIRDSLAMGVAAAAITVSRRGANPPYRGELDMGD